MIEFVIGIVLGFLVGAIGLYFAQQKKIKLINQKLQQSRRLLEDSEVANREHATELQELKLEQEEIRQLQAQQKSRQEELEKSYRAEIQQLQVGAEAKLKELENAYAAHLEALQIERREDLQKIQQYESQIQAFNQGSVIPEGEEDFSEELFLEEEEGATAESGEGIESLLDLFADLVDEPELKVPTTASVKVEEKIEAIAALSTAAAIPQLSQYIYEPDSKIRALIATTLGKISGGKNKGVETNQLIANLGKLSRDTDPSVRQSAVAALGKIGSANAIPLLKIAQRDTDSDVVKSASAALDKFKGYRASKQKKALPKNASLLQKNAES